MAVRTVSVLLTADIAAFRARMGEASRTANRTSNDIRTSMRNAGRTMTQVGESQRNALKAVQGGSIALIAAFGFAVAASARFEKAMSNVAAVTQASAGEMAGLRAAALEAGRTTAYSATQAAEAEFELAKAGIAVADIAGGALKGSLNLAAAAQIDLSEAAEISATTMTVFGLKGKDVGHIADVLAAAANKSATDVHQLGLSFKMTAQVAAQTGLTLEDTTGAMALFASEGLKGSDAGTSFKVMLQRLTPQSKEAQATMDRLGFSAYDANGNFVGLHEVAQRMKEAFGNLTPEARNAAMGVIFGSDAVRAAGILYKHGEAGVRKYTDAVDDQGYAAAVAATKMNNLIGDLELLKSALETALIESGSAANAALRDMVQWVTRLVNVYNGLPPALQQTAGVMTGLVGVLGLAAASMLLLLPRIMLVRRELAAMGVTAATVRAQMMTLGKLGLVLGTLTALAWGIDTVVRQLDNASPSVAKLTNSMLDFERKGKATGEAARLFGESLDGVGEAAARIAHPGVLDRFEDFFSTFDPMAEGGPGLEKARTQLKAIDESLSSLVQSGATKEAARQFALYAAEAEKGGTSTEKFRTLLPGYAETLAGADTQTKLAADSQGQLGSEAATTADELADQRTEAEKLTDALSTLNGVAIDAAQKEISFRDSLRSLTEAVKENGTSLDVTTAKGSAVKGAFLDAADAAMAHAQSVAEQQGSMEAGNAVLGANISALRMAMDQAGFTKKQIDDLTASYLRLPQSAATSITAPGAVKAALEVDRLYMEVAGLQPGKTVTIKAPTSAAIKELRAAGYQVKAIPGSKSVKVTAPTGTAVANAEALKRAIDNLRSRTITVTTRHVVTGDTARARGSHGSQLRAGGGRIRRYAEGGSVWGFPAGGMVAGPGSSTSDSIPAWLSNGEYVIRAAAVSKYGLAMFDQINAMRLASGGAVGYAKGGKAKKTPQSVLTARRELPGDFGDFSRSLTKAAGDIRTASNALIADLKKLGSAGWKLAGQVDRTSRKLQTMAAQRDRIRARITEAKEYASTQRTSAMDFMALGEGRDAAALIQGLKEQQSAAFWFRRNTASLEKRGLHKDLLAQVIAEGPGGALASKLLGANSSEFAQLNQLARRGSTLATSIGRTTADAMYDAGRMAGAGFLTGLQAQEKALQQQMSKLGKSMVASIKKALKIKSPSQVMRDQVGRQLGAGLVQGMDQSLVDVQAAGSRMSAAAVNAAWGRPLTGAVVSPGGGTFEGPLYLDSGEFLGVVRGVVRPMLRESEQRQARRAKVGRAT
ncbi:phage tail tape measure protein [Streptomyces pacificus]|uniref:Phage tail tape measure protein n=1 Tax=Streptomyces pacificus TaxID=2705029 RepID=A0A6A0AMW4_9ACTN|nr:phage tail tape measure protein [Streptomyces pacificus]GFH34286.1 phage tail tape measure protein [Streptomyces pacificus]